MPDTQLNLVRQGSGPTLVLIHGVAGSLRIWDPIVDELAEDFTVVRMDLLGYGHSPKPHTDYTPTVHIDAIRSTLLVNDIKPPYNLVGLSMGVNLALEFSARYPDEVDGFIGLGFPYFKDAASAKKGLRRNIWVRLAVDHPWLSALVVPPLWWLGRNHLVPTTAFSEIYTEAMAHEALLNPYYIFRSTLFNCMINNHLDPLLDASSDKRRLFLTGTNDKWAKQESVAEAIEKYPRSQLKIVPESSHNVVILQPKVTAGFMKDYLKTIIKV